jgi:hypothetical protein
LSERVRVSLLDLHCASAEAELAGFFASCPTSVAQQTPGWRRVLEALGDEPRVLACRRADGELVGALPAYRFAGPLGAILVSCAQAGPLGGVACRPGADRASVYAALLDAFEGRAFDEGCALATVFTNPFWPDRELCEQRFTPDFLLENHCQVLDLRAALDAAGTPTGGSQSLRRNLRRARAGALRIDEEQSPQNVAAWYAVHARRHTEIGATPLPEPLFRAALEHAVPAGVARFFFVRASDTGELVGGGLYLQHGAVMDALMPSVSTDAASLGAAYLLALHSMRHAQQSGLRFYNWQGSPPEGGVYRFKRQWGSSDRSYAYLTRVTGDAGRLLASSPAELRAAYPFHYVLPYDRLGGPGPGASTRQQAWQAGALGAA